MDLCICIPTHAGRLAMLSRTLEALAASINASGLKCEVRLFPDAGMPFDPPHFREMPIVRYDLPNRRLYADLNIIRARAISFEESEAPLVLSMDDDILVTPSFIHDLVASTRWASHRHRVITQSSITCTGTQAFKEALLPALCIGFATGTHYCMDRGTHALIYPFLDEYAQRFLKTPPEERNNDHILTWLREQALIFKTVDPWTQDVLVTYRTNNSGTSHDAVTLLAALLTYTVPCHMAVNRAITVGDTGSTMSPEQFTAHRNVKLDSLPVASSFRWWPAPHRVMLDL